VQLIRELKPQTLIKESTERETDAGREQQRQTKDSDTQNTRKTATENDGYRERGKRTG